MLNTLLCTVQGSGAQRMSALIQTGCSADLDQLLPLLTVSPHIPTGNAANNLSQGKPALFASFAYPPKKVSKQLAFICQAFLICFGFQPAAESALQVGLTHLATTHTFGVAVAIITVLLRFVFGCLHIFMLSHVIVSFKVSVIVAI